MMRHQPESYLRIDCNTCKAYHTGGFAFPVSLSNYCLSLERSIRNETITNNKETSLILTPTLLLFLLLSLENYATLLCFS